MPPATFILIVDDHQELLDLAERVLLRDQLEVVCARDVVAARHQLATYPVALIILDLGLPDVSGLQLCRELRKSGRLVPILILTAQNSVATRVECLDAGADDHLSKPFAIAELRARVRALLRRANTPAVAAYRFGDVALDFAARRATKASQQAPVTAREWSILESLARAGGEVLSRQELLERAWPESSSDKAGSLDVLIGRIRRKLGSDIVRTLRNQGYCLAPSETVRQSGRHIGRQSGPQ